MPSWVAISAARTHALTALILLGFGTGCGVCPPDVKKEKQSPTGRYVATSYEPGCGGPLAPFSERLGIRASTSDTFDEVLTIVEVPLYTSTLAWTNDTYLVVTIECRFSEEASCLRQDRHWSVTMEKRWGDVQIEYHPGPKLLEAGGPHVMERLIRGQ